MGSPQSSLPPRQVSPFRQLLKDFERQVRAGVRKWKVWRKKSGVRRRAAHVDLRQLAAERSGREGLALLLIVDDCSHEWLLRCLRSLREQATTAWRLLVVSREAEAAHIAQMIADARLNADRVEQLTLESSRWHWAAALQAGLVSIEESHVVLLSGEERLEPDALLWFAVTLEEQPNALWIYGDEIELNDDGQIVEFHYKPDYSELYLWARFFPGRLGCYETNLLRRVAPERTCDGIERWYDLALRLSDACDSPTIVHVDQILAATPWRDPTAPGAQTQGAAECQAVSAALQRRGIAAQVTTHPADPRLHEFRFEPKELPPLSIIIPNRNSAEMLQSCISAARATTHYPSYEIVVVDHASDEPALLEYLEQETASGVLRVVPYRGPFNFADMNNRAIATSDSDWVVLLNNDVDGFSPEWLEQLVATAQLDEQIAMVGALLYYPDGTVQHGGVFFGLGQTGRHGHIDLPHDALGYCGRLRSLQEVSALTAALVLVRRSAFDAVGGFDTKYPSDFNDFDLCLRLRQAGYKLVYTPHVTACHYSSKTRRHRDRRRVIMQRQWGELLLHDPFYNANLSNERFELSEMNDIWAERKRVALAERLWRMSHRDSAFRSKND